MAGDASGARGRAAALALLIAVSVYRQLSLRLLPGDVLRPWLVCAVYFALLLYWGVSIRRRFTQRSMRLFLLLEILVMLLWLAVRLVQETFAACDIQLVRVLGYVITVPAAAVPLLGLYAAFGLGRWDEYRFSRRWYLLAIPAAALIALALTNESHHLLYSAAAGEPQPNLRFHPNVGIYVVYGWGFALIAARTLVIWRRSRPFRGAPALRRLAPFFEPLALVLFLAPYTAASFQVRWELVELSAGAFLIEAASWELFIRLGLIPVNTQYQRVFDRSTAGMQIVSGDGRVIVRSDSAPDLTPEQFSALRLRRPVTTADGQELLAYPIRGGYFVWQRDVSQIRSVIDRLRRTESALRQESGLLAQELKLRSEQAAVAEQNRIYDRLTVEVGPQLRLLRQLLAKKDAVADQAALFGQICLIGAYVKRRCSLRLLEQTDGAISGEDLALSFRDLTDRLRESGADARLCWCGAALPSARFALRCLDVFEFLMEYHHFSLRAVAVSLLPDAALSIRVCPGGPGGAGAPEAALARMGADGLAVCCEERPDGYAVRIREGGQADAKTGIPDSAAD